jgi:flagellar hook-length control protein FliK
MQADLLMEFDKIFKMSAEKQLTPKVSLKSNSNSNQNNISGNDLDGKSFLEFVSMLIEETSTDSFDGKQMKQAFERILGQGSSSSLGGLEGKKAEQVLEKIISEEESSSILAGLLPFFDTNKRPIDQNVEKRDSETLLLLLQKLSLLQENTTLQSKEHPLQNGTSFEDQRPIVALESDGNSSEGNGNKPSILFSAEDKGLFSNSTKMKEDTSSDENNKFTQITSQRNLQSNSRHQSSDEKLDTSDSKDQKITSDMKFMLPKVSSDSKDPQSSETGKIKLSAQSDFISQNHFENKKEILRIVDKARGQKIKAHSGKLDNPSTTSSMSIKSISLANNAIGFSKNDINAKIANFNGGDEHKHSSDSNGLSENFNSKFEAILEDGGLNHEKDSEVKLTSAKISSTVNDTKPLPRTESLNQTEIIKQIVEKVNLSSNKEHNKITIKLKPEILGNLRLNISTENHHVTIKVMADSPMVKEMLENNLHHLKNGFVNHGLEIGSFDVMVGDQPESFNKERHFSGFRRDRRQLAGQKKFTLDGTKEELIADPVRLYRTNTTNDSIDYYV